MWFAVRAADSSALKNEDPNTAFMRGFGTRLTEVDVPGAGPGVVSPVDADPAGYAIDAANTEHRLLIASRTAQAHWMSCYALVGDAYEHLSDLEIATVGEAPQYLPEDAILDELGRLHLLHHMESELLEFTRLGEYVEGAASQIVHTLPGRIEVKKLGFDSAGIPFLILADYIDPDIFAPHIRYYFSRFDALDQTLIYDNESEDKLFQLAFPQPDYARPLGQEVAAYMYKSDGQNPSTPCVAVCSDAGSDQTFLQLHPGSLSIEVSGRNVALPIVVERYPGESGLDAIAVSDGATQFQLTAPLGAQSWLAGNPVILSVGQYSHAFRFTTESFYPSAHSTYHIHVALVAEDGKVTKVPFHLPEQDSLDAAAILEESQFVFAHTIVPANPEPLVLRHIVVTY